MFPPVYILRHGQTEWNAQLRIQGRLDSRLTDLGRDQARAQRGILQARDLSGFGALSSPQGRAFHTAAIALEGIAPCIETDTRLMEIGVGAWEGLYRVDLPLTQPQDQSEESALELYRMAPGGEGFAALHRRCHEFLTDLSKPSILVTHGITSRMLRLVLLGRDISEIGDLPGGQGVIYHLEHGKMHQLTIGA
ncbi:histidine phosphatase family protein [Roseobacter sp.]|uniref:histidine phosphatase family protein n=1 Tax=Roseobacter sp. TaxID=1907202 RepID=UPI0032989A49